MIVSVTQKVKDFSACIKYTLCMTEYDKGRTGKRVKELRDDLGYTQIQLAELVGVANNTITQYENGTSNMSLFVLVRTAQVLKTTTDYLLGLEN